MDTARETHQPTWYAVFFSSASLLRFGVHPSVPVLLIALAVIIRAVPEAANNVSGLVSDATMSRRRGEDDPIRDSPALPPYLRYYLPSNNALALFTVFPVWSIQWRFKYQKQRKQMSRTGKKRRGAPPLQIAERLKICGAEQGAA